MIITYFRSSSLANWKFCQLQYYITYVLGYQRDAGKKAELGTIVHKVLELLAIAKQQSDETLRSTVTITDNTGTYTIDTESWMKPYFHTFESAEAINKTRINKEKYRTACRLAADHTHYGKECIESLTKQVYTYYSGRSKHTYERIDFIDVQNWVWMALDYHNGAYDPRRKKIVSPEKSFDFEIKRKWSKYSYEFNGEKIAGNLGIKGTIDLVTDVGDGVYEIVDWKGLPLDTPIPTLDGWKTMGDLTTSDILFDKDGQQTKILAKSKPSYKQCYKITFDDTSTVICDYEHQWLLLDNRVVATTELTIGDEISVAKSLKIDDVQLPIDPYLLGMWLGDGRNRSADITSGDFFVFDEIVRRGYSLGKNTKREPYLQARTVLNTTSKLRALNLLHNKHIPNIYLRSSIRQRLDLLRGLMDSDGNANTIRKQAVFTNCCKQLSDDVKELATSLGQRVNQCYVNVDTNFKSNVDVYPLHFRPININPFLLPRKADKIDPNWGSGQSYKRTIKTIEILPDKIETQCIMVDSPSSTYLCTKNMIPTHNSGRRLNWATGEEKDYEALKKDSQLILYYYAARHLFPEAKAIMLTIFFIRDGGPFTICFDDNTLVEAENILRDQMKEISSCKEPKMLDPKQRDFRCNKLCDYYKQQMDGTNTCLAVGKQIKLLGIGPATEKLKNPNFQFGQYQAPGGE